MSYTRGALPQDHFTMVSTRWLRDPRLSAKAKGLLAYLCSHKEGYRVTLEQMIAQMADGKKAIYSGLKELRDLGYLTLERDRDPESGALGPAYYRVADAPWQTPHAEKGEVAPTSSDAESAQVSPLAGNGEVAPTSEDAAKPQVVPTSPKRTTKETSFKEISKKDSAEAAAAPSTDLDKPVDNEEPVDHARRLASGFVKAMNDQHQVTVSFGQAFSICRSQLAGGMPVVKLERLLGQLVRENRPLSANTLVIADQAQMPRGSTTSGGPVTAIAAEGARLVDWNVPKSTTSERVAQGIGLVQKFAVEEGYIDQASLW